VCCVVDWCAPRARRRGARRAQPSSRRSSCSLTFAVVFSFLPINNHQGQSDDSDLGSDLACHQTCEYHFLFLTSGSKSNKLRMRFDQKDVHKIHF
jgi:hypothetical protein